MPKYKSMGHTFHFTHTLLLVGYCDRFFLLVIKSYNWIFFFCHPTCKSPEPNNNFHNSLKHVLVFHFFSPHLSGSCWLTFIASVCKLIWVYIVLKWIETTVCLEGTTLRKTEGKCYENSTNLWVWSEWFLVMLSVVSMELNFEPLLWFASPYL